MATFDGSRTVIWIETYNKGTGGRHRPETNPSILLAPELVEE